MPAVEWRVRDRNGQHLVRPARVIVAALAIDEIEEGPPRGFQNRALNDSPQRRASRAMSSASMPAAARTSHDVQQHSALCHSALISTGLPRRGVTTQPPTFASIHVSGRPSVALREQAVAGST